MTWSLLTSATETFSLLTSAVEAWAATSSVAKTYSLVTSGANENWTDDTVSDTTTRNTSRFVLLSAISYSGGYMNLQPAYRSTADNARGGGFYWTSTDPVVYHATGETVI